MESQKLKNLLSLIGEELRPFLKLAPLLYGLFFICFYSGSIFYIEKTRAQELNLISNPLLTDIEFEEKEQKPSSSEIETSTLLEKSPAILQSSSDPLKGFTKSSGQNREKKFQNELYIPVLNIRAPIIAMNSTNPEDYKEVLKKGVALFPSALPGKKGRIIILGHSAPPTWPEINYDRVFNNLQDLKKGDIIIVTFKDKEYIFKVKVSKILDKGENLPLLKSSNSSSEIVLITCWPPGIDYKRFAVFGQKE